MKIIFFGNSITQHPYAPQIGWYGNYGMAASSVDSDYVHVLKGLIEKRGIEADIRVVNVNDYEIYPTSTKTDELAKNTDFDADVVIIRLVENVPLAMYEQFAIECGRLINLIKNEHNNIICVGSFIKSDSGDELIKKIALKTKSIYLSLCDIQGKEYQAVGLFDNPGIEAHPSDKGMSAIAEHIYNCMIEKEIFY